MRTMLPWRDARSQRNTLMQSGLGAELMFTLDNSSYQE